jgi:DNA-binding NtrC family response regulator
MIDHSTIRVLIVDDEPSIRWSLVCYLEDYDFDVKSADSAEGALNSFANNVYDVMIIDLRLPGISGESLILKAHEMIPDMKFMIYTGSVNYRISDELKEIGINQENVYLKPIKDLSVIIQGIENLFQRMEDEN